MDAFEPSIDDKALSQAVARDVRANPALYGLAAAWFDAMASVRSTRRWVARVVLKADAQPFRARRQKRAHGPYGHAWVPDRHLRFNCVLHHLGLEEKRQGTAVLTREEALRLLLFLWLLTDESAHSIEPLVCEMQSWGAKDASDLVGQFGLSFLLPDRQWPALFEVARVAWEERLSIQQPSPPRSVGVTPPPEPFANLADPDETLPPALTDNDIRVLETMAIFDPSRLVSAQMISDEMEPKTALSVRTIGPILQKLTQNRLAERPEGDRSGSRLTLKGRRLVPKIAD